MLFSLPSLPYPSAMAAVSRADAGGASGVAVMPGKRNGMGRSPAWLLIPCSLFLALAGVATLAEGAVYKVGDAAGWTIVGGVNYTAWAASKTFRVGDTIVFQYNRQFHNVIEVSRADYRACNSQSPLSTYTSGNDSISLKRAGHHFFLCGVPGHCAIGQKVDIRIPKRARAAAPPSSDSSPSPSSTTSTPPTFLTGDGAPAPQKSRAAPHLTDGWALVLVTVLAVAVAAATSAELR